MRFNCTQDYTYSLVRTSIIWYTHKPIVQKQTGDWRQNWSNCSTLHCLVRTVLHQYLPQNIQNDVYQSDTTFPYHLLSKWSWYKKTLQHFGIFGRYKKSVQNGNPCNILYMISYVCHMSLVYNHCFTQKCLWTFG